MGLKVLLLAVTVVLVFFLCGFSSMKDGSTHTRCVIANVQVVDMQNDSSSGAGWTIGKDGLPKLPINR